MTTAPKAGPVATMKSSEIKPGMKAVAWTVFEGSTPEAVPIEIVGLWKNAWGPKQDIILGKMGGKALRTGVAGGMSGSPVYVDGKLIGAVALRISVFSPDAICGITPIELMLEINEFDKSMPPEAKAPDKAPARRAAIEVPNDLLQRVIAAGASAPMAETPMMVPIETPLVFSGFNEVTLREFGPMFRQMGITPVMGGGGAAAYDAKPAANWSKALQPGQAVAGLLVSGDMSLNGLGTVTYNDGKRVLAFGHPFFNLGPVNMPMSAGEILMVLSSQFQPNKMGNATEIVGMLRQDRHSGIMGVLGEQADMIPVTVKVRSHGAEKKEKDFRYNIFVNQKWTPFLTMLTMFNSVSGINDFADDATYRLSGQIDFEGSQPQLKLTNMQAPSEMPIPAPMMLASWLGDKVNRLFGNSVAMPKVKRVEMTVDLFPERRIATIDNAWASRTEVAAGEEITVKAFLRPYRGERIERELKLRIPEGMPKGEHRILLSDGDQLNRFQMMAGMSNRFLSLEETVSLLNQERNNTTLYASLMQMKPTVFADDKMLPSVPQSVLNVMQLGRTPSRGLTMSPETVVAQATAPFEQVVNGSYSLRIVVR